MYSIHTTSPSYSWVFASCCVCEIPVRGSLFLLRNVTILGFYYYLLLLKLLHILVVRPSSGRNKFARFYSSDNGSVVFRIYLTLWITIVIDLKVDCFVDVVAVVYNKLPVNIQPQPHQQSNQLSNRSI
jgi:hydrogenase-4 membrane subunit HyfE